MWTKKAAVFVTIAVVGLVLGLILRDPQLLLVGVIFLSAVLIAYFSVQRKLEIKRLITTPKVFEGDRMPVKLRIEGKGFNMGITEVYDKLPSVMSVVKGNNDMHTNLGRKEKIHMEYTIKCPLRGYYNLGPVLVRQSDQMGMFVDKRSISNTSPVAVYPQLDHAKKVPVDSRYRKLHPGALTMKYVGQGSEFHSIREYLPSDPFKTINWKVTARLRKLMVNQHEVEDVFDTMILVDARALTRSGTITSNPLEMSVKGAATIADYLMKRSNRVGVVTYGDTVRVIPPASGEAQMIKVLSLLTQTYAGGRTDMRRAYQKCSPYLTPRSPVIIFSPLTDDRSAKKVLRELAVKKHDVVIISPNDLEFEKKAVHVVPPIYHLLKMKRANMLNELSAIGAKVVDWSPDQDITTILTEVLIK